MDGRMIKIALSISRRYRQVSKEVELSTNRKIMIVCLNDNRDTERWEIENR